MIFSICFCDEKTYGVLVIADTLKEAWDKFQTSKFVNKRPNFFYIDKYVSDKDYVDIHKEDNPQLYKGVFYSLNKGDYFNNYVIADSDKQAMDYFCKLKKGEFIRFERNNSLDEDIIIF